MLHCPPQTKFPLILLYEEGTRDKLVGGQWRKAGVSGEAENTESEERLKYLYTFDSENIIPSLKKDTMDFN